MACQEMRRRRFSNVDFRATHSSSWPVKSPKTTEPALRAPKPSPTLLPMCVIMSSIIHYLATKLRGVWGHLSEMPVLSATRRRHRSIQIARYVHWPDTADLEWSQLTQLQQEGACVLYLGIWGERPSGRPFERARRFRYGARWPALAAVSVPPVLTLRTRQVVNPPRTARPHALVHGGTDL